MKDKIVTVKIDTAKNECPIFKGCAAGQHDGRSEKRDERWSEMLMRTGRLNEHVPDVWFIPRGFHVGLSLSISN
jgi:hypothetical protein